MSSPLSLSAVRNGRGSRLPKNEPVCVMRKRVRRGVLESGEVVEVGAVGDRHDLADGTALAHLVRDRVGDADDGVRRPRDQLRDGVFTLFLRSDEHSLGVAVRVSDDRVTQVGDPRNAGRPLDGCPDEVDRGRRRRGDDDVDALALHDPDRGRDRGEVPADVLVRHEQPPPGELQLLRSALEAGRPVQLLGRLASLRPEVARTMDPGECRSREPFVAVDPLGVVRREHVRLDPELRQVRGELQRALHSTASGGREVHRDEQDLHCGRR